LRCWRWLTMFWEVAPSQKTVMFIFAAVRTWNLT
jgi:hypothetical protein